MSWLFSRALVEDCSQVNCSDGEQCAPLNVKPTQHKFWRNDKTMDFSRLSRFGLTCAVLTESRGEELLMLYLEGFRARILAQQGEDLGLEAKGQDCGRKTSESLMKSGQLELFQKTHPGSREEGLTLLFKTLPRSGIAVHGQPLEQRDSELSIYERGYGYLPTPTAHNAKEGAYPAEYTRNTPTLATHAGGKINPEWTEWLMGWSIGWTDLKPLETDRFQSWRQQHISILNRLYRE